jgi:hypothetical protein
MQTETLRRFGRIGVLVTAAVVAVSVASPALADSIRLRRLQTDEQGEFTVLFSAVDANRDPIVDVAQLPISGLRLAGSREPAGLDEASAVLRMEEPRMQPLKDYGAPFSIFLMLPNNDTFNGTEGNENRPDAAGLRNAVRQALASLPTDRSDISINIAFYNSEVRWVPAYNASQVAELSSALTTRNEYIAPAGTRVEDPFNAIDQAYRTRLRRQARPAGSSDFAYFFVIVTSALTEVADSETFSAELQRLRGLMSARDMQDVTTFVIVYNPLYDAEILFSPEFEPVRFAQGFTPANGTQRIVGNIADIRTALRQTFDEIVSSFVLRFKNRQLEGDTNYYFRLRAQSSGEEVTSNMILAGVTKVPVDLWGLIILIGSIVIGAILLTILVIWLIKRPKKEAAKPVPVIQQAVELCVQCGRQLRDDVNYCHHCAAEPNYGLLKVLESPLNGGQGSSGWTFFLRETITEVGKAAGNNLLLKGDAGISSNHMKLSVQEGSRYLIEDLGSTNGTYIGNQRVNKQFLRNGDVIALGTATKLKFTIS